MSHPATHSLRPPGSLSGIVSSIKKCSSARLVHSPSLISLQLCPSTMSGDKPPAELDERLKAALGALTMANPSQPKDKYAFWGTQPVVQFGEGSSEAVEDGPIDAIKTVDELRKEPFKLPDSFQWSDCNVDSDAELAEIYELLTYHYVEDDDNMFRFAYSKEFLRWALQPPGFRKDWHCGVRVSSTGKLVAFISAIPATLRANAATLSVVEINFLCVHKKLRHKRLAPVLIREITRRVNLTGVWQAVYTAGVVLPKPAAECQYWHRSLNPKKLISIGFSRLAPRMTMARTLKLYKLPDQPATPGLRPMEKRDVPQVCKLLEEYLQRYKLAPILSEDEVDHWLVWQKDVVYTYVVEQQQQQQPGGQQQQEQQQQQSGGEASGSSSGGSGGGSGVITGFLSFYTLPSTVIGNPQYNELKAAYMFYTVPGPTPLPQLLNDALVLAHSTGHDVFNALDILENGPLLRDLKFGVGDGKLRYYLYNWRVARELAPGDVGLVML